MLRLKFIVCTGVRTRAGTHAANRQKSCAGIYVNIAAADQ